LLNKDLGDEGIEQTPLALSKTAISETLSAKSGARDAPTRFQDPDLALIVHRWPDLPQSARAAVLRIVRQHTPQTQDRRENP